MELLKLTTREFNQVAKLIYDRTGIHLPPEKLGLLSNRLRKRLRVLELGSFQEYYKLLTDAARCEEELPHFLSAVTTNETYFYRNTNLWNFFSGDLIRHFVDTKPAGRKTIRVWSAASSSGEEAYTTAIVLREKLPAFSSWKVNIIASDISNNVLDKAKAGLYDDYAVSKMDPSLVKRWFTPADGKHQLRDEIRKIVTFQFHNLREPFPNGRFDVVFLRNVLMYFDNNMKKRVIKVTSDALAPGGHLIVGDVDPIRTIPELNDAMTLEYQRPGIYLKPVGSRDGIAKKHVARA